MGSRLHLPGSPVQAAFAAKACMFRLLTDAPFRLPIPHIQKSNPPELCFRGLPFWIPTRMPSIVSSFLNDENCRSAFCSEVCLTWNLVIVISPRIIIIDSGLKFDSGVEIQISVYAFAPILLIFKYYITACGIDFTAEDGYMSAISIIATAYCRTENLCYSGHFSS